MWGEGFLRSLHNVGILCFDITLVSSVLCLKYAPNSKTATLQLIFRDSKCKSGGGTKICKADTLFSKAWNEASRCQSWTNLKFAVQIRTLNIRQNFTKKFHICGSICLFPPPSDFVASDHRIDRSVRCEKEEEGWRGPRAQADPNSDRKKQELLSSKDGNLVSSRSQTVREAFSGNLHLIFAKLIID